ncbi:MAG: hypothetical protein ABI658_01105 [Acidimicrobiales bacterium]
MTTTATTQFPGSSPRRIRRTVIAALAAGALIVSSGFAVNRIVGDPSTVAVQTPNIARLEVAVASPSAVPAADVCSGGLAWACTYAQLPTVVTTADVCSGGLAWACTFTVQH